MCDQGGERWRLSGDLAALGLERDGGRLFSRRFPDPFRRIEGALAGAPAGRIYVSAWLGAELVARGTRFHGGGGAAGSLHGLDSYVPLLIAGGGEATLPADLARTVDVVPLALRILGAGEGLAARATGEFSS